jgi:hypothetical protein
MIAHTCLCARVCTCIRVCCVRSYLEHPYLRESVLECVRARVYVCACVCVCVCV